MSSEDKLYFDKIFVQKISEPLLKQKNVALSVLRLDEVHPVISGNKWFKLKYYLQEAKQKGFNTIGTFGGAWSNHIVATAYACKLNGLKCIGIIRGEKPLHYSATLLNAAKYKMQLHFVSRSEYKNPSEIQKQFQNIYWINEGGYGIKGAEGASEILATIPGNLYSHIVCAVGSGTMMAGLVKAATSQTVIGISVLKGNTALNEKVCSLLTEKEQIKTFSINSDFHFGGYAKYNQQLLAFMRTVWYEHKLPTDIVYTSKTFFAVRELIANDTIKSGSNVLMIHSGGLQGNLSLPANTLPF